MPTVLLHKNMNTNKLRAYADLIRLNKPIGTLLLMWPMLIALWVASGGMPSFKSLIVFIGGAFLMRSAGCAINDYADRHFDKHVERTKNRPLALDLITPTEALRVASVCALSAFCLVLCTNMFAVYLSVLGVMLAFVYPFLKRYTHLPQFFLGAAFAWAIPMVYAAINNDLPQTLWWLYVATLLWAVAYDTQYALVDIKDDMQVGVKSTAILFGRNTNLVVLSAHLLSATCLLFYVAFSGLLGIKFMLCLSASLMLVFYQQDLIKNHDPKQCFKAFLNNQWIGAFWFLGILLELH